MGLPNPLSALPHVLAAALARLRGGDRDSRESPETDAFSPVKHRDDASRLADSPDGHRGEDPEASTRTLDETRAAPPARDAEARCADGTGDRRGGAEDRGATENARTTVRTSHDERNDDDASASSASSPSSPRPEGASGVPWDALPEACVQRVFLHAGFRAALCAGATCTSWRRVLDSPHFWKTTFASHFGVGREILARDFFAPRVEQTREEIRGVSSCALTKSLRPKQCSRDTEVSLFFDWRGAFAEETKAQRRWATGRCVATSSLRAADEWNDVERKNVAGIAARRGTCLVAFNDGRIATYDLLCGGAEVNASWLNDGLNDGVTGDGDAYEQTVARHKITCFAFCETSGVCVFGDDGGTLAAYDVTTGARVWRTSTSDTKTDDDTVKTPRPTCVAVGAGVAVFGFKNGTTQTFEIASGSRVTRQSATMSSEVTLLAVCDATGFVAAAAGAEVATWPLFSDDDKCVFLDASDEGFRTSERAGDTSRSERETRVTWLAGHDDHVRCLRFFEVAGRGDESRLRGPRTALLTAGDDATTRLWDVCSGALLLELEGPPGTTEAEHAGQVPVEWTYTPPPPITALDVWCGLIVEGRNDGSVLVWTGALERVSAAMRDRHERLSKTPEESDAREPEASDVVSERKTPLDATDARADGAPSLSRRPGSGESSLGDGSSPSRESDSFGEDTPRRDRPATYRRWWAHADRVTKIVANRGRVVSVSADGSCHVLALSADTLARAARWKKTEKDESRAPRAPPPASPPRRRSADFFETGAAAAAAARGVATRAWRGGEFAGAAAAAAARRTAESWSETSHFASAAAVGSEAFRVADRLSGGLGTNAALAADLFYTVGVTAGASAASAAARAAHAAASVTASAAAETASIAERLSREVGRGASSIQRSASDAVAEYAFGVERRNRGGFGNETSTYGLWVFEDGGSAFFPGFGFGGYARGWTFKEHGTVVIECIAVTGQALITADVHGNVVVRHFGDRAAAAPA